MRIIILHGWGHSAAHWNPIAEKLVRFGSVETWDLPGFGNEPLVSATWTITQYADWVQDKIGGTEEDIVLIGHSFGGRIASILAARQPPWLRALILIGAPSIYRPSAKIRIKSTIASLVKPFVPSSLRCKLLPEELRDAEDAGIGRVFRNAVTNDQTKALPMIAVPTLLIWGANDDAAPMALAHEIKTLIPGSKLVILPGLGHNVHLENPLLTYGTIEQFVESV
ncbi:MAG: alpha/beta hydrolase [Patescibacteria group bacterium]